MKRSPRIRRLTGTAVVVAVLTTLLFTVSNPTSADAQAATDASLGLTVSPADAEQPFRTVAVSVDPGSSGLAAVGATLSFDATKIQVSSCEVSEIGACNVTDQGTVLVSVFNLTGIDANEQLLTVNFTPMPAATGTSTFELTVDTAVNFNGAPLASIEPVSVQVELAPIEFGALTGDVIAASSETALYALDVCAVNDSTQVSSCTTTTGLGTWRIDDLQVGGYTVTVRDSTGVYTSASTIGTVTADQVTAGVDVALAFATNDAAPEVDSTDTAVENPEPTGTTPLGPRPKPLVIVYQASIAGRITGIDTGLPITALQVCATQPLVLHQSCATTNDDGVFFLDGVSAGNYWVTAVDPLGRFEDATPKLVGVVGDDIAREGVRLRLTPVG